IRHFHCMKIGLRPNGYFPLMRQPLPDSSSLMQFYRHSTVVAFPKPCTDTGANGRLVSNRGFILCCPLIQTMVFRLQLSFAERPIICVNAEVPWTVSIYRLELQEPCA
ncbi:hypothetical protein AALA24_13020, partial [Anaerovoracaceae bacterium 42-11]